MKNIYRLSIFVIVSILAGLLLYQFSLIKVISAVIHRQGSSHGVFVPFFSLFFLWIKRDVLKKIEPEYNFWGLFVIILGILPVIFSINNFQLHFIGYIFFISGLILTILGKRFFKQIAFPLFFLIAMTPLPENLYEALANYSRHIALGGALKIVSFFGIPYIKEGWVIQLPNVVLNVGIGCSGIRYLISYVVFGLAYAWLYKSTLKGRLLVIALIIPISYLASIFRLTAIFTLAHTFGPHMADHRPHIIISWSVFFIVLIASIAVDQYLQERRYAGREKCTSIGS